MSKLEHLNLNFNYSFTGQYKLCRVNSLHYLLDIDNYIVFVTPSDLFHVLTTLLFLDIEIINSCTIRCLYLKDFIKSKKNKKITVLVKHSISRPNVNDKVSFEEVEIIN